MVSDVTMPACALGAHPSPHRLAATRDAVRIPGMVITGSSDRDDARRRTRLTLVLCRKIVLWSTADGVIQGNRVNAILSNFRINWSLCTNQNCSVRAQAETIESKKALHPIPLRVVAGYIEKIMHVENRYQKVRWMLSNLHQRHRCSPRVRRVRRISRRTPLATLVLVYLALPVVLIGMMIAATCRSLG